MATDKSALFGILLRPQATEACYGYIEKLLLDALSKRPVVFDSGPDTLIDLVRLLDMTLRRAGVGWTSIVAKKVSKHICLEILGNVKDHSESSESMLEALAVLMGYHPLVVRCEQEGIVSELVRLLKLNSKHSPALLLCVHSVLGACRPDEVSLYRFVSQGLATMALAETSVDVILSLRILLQVGADYIMRDAQLTRTTLGLCLSSRNRFHDNMDIRRLCEELYSALSLCRNNEEDDDSFATPTCDTIPVSEEVVIEETIEIVASETFLPSGDKQMTISEDLDDLHSPRSSCPSL